MHDLCVGMLIWNDFLKKVLLCYFEAMNVNILLFETGLSSYPQKVIENLKKTDIFITEAFNPLKIDNPEGFRLALTIMKLNFTTKPIVVFQHLEDVFIKIPVLMDFSTIHHLPEKIQALKEIDKPDKSIFDKLIATLPGLTMMPIHKRVV